MTTTREVSVIHGESIGPVTMAAMLRAMVAAMLLRRTEHSQPVHTHARSREDRRVRSGWRPMSAPAGGGKLGRVSSTTEKR